MSPEPPKIVIKLLSLFEASASGTLGIGAVVFLALVYMGGRAMRWW